MRLCLVFVTYMMFWVSAVTPMSSQGMAMTAATPGVKANEDGPNDESEAGGSFTPGADNAPFSGAFDISNYGAKCDGKTDDAVAINRTIAAARAAVTANQLVYPAVVFPAGLKAGCVARATGINFTGMSNTNLIGNGASILCEQADEACFDGLGSQHSSINDLNLIGLGRKSQGRSKFPTIGLQVGRAGTLAAVNGCAELNTRNLRIMKSFSIAGLYNFACEDTDFHNTKIIVDSMGFAAIEDGPNHWNVASSFITTGLQVNHTRGMDENEFSGNTVLDNTGRGQLLWVEGSSSLDFENMYGNQRNTSLAQVILYDGGLPGGGPIHNAGTGQNVNFICHCHFEQGPNKEFEVDGPNTAPTIYGFQFYDRASQIVGGAIFNIGIGVAKANISNLIVMIPVTFSLSRKEGPGTIFDNPLAWSGNGTIMAPAQMENEGSTFTGLTQATNVIAINR